MKARSQILKQFAAQAKEYDRVSDVTLRTQASQNWRELATAAEAAKAPSYLSWYGRKSGK
jgi:hypothetical protein